MEQVNVMDMEPGTVKQCCLSDPPVAQVQEDAQVFKLVVETTHYRVEIEIG